MSSYAQEWVWRYSKAQGLAKFVFLAIARRIFRNGGVETPPTSVEHLMTVTGLSEGTVRRSIRELEQTHGELDVVKSERRGTVHRFRLRQALQLPLLDADAAPAASAIARIGGVGGSSPIRPVGVSDPSDRCHPPVGSVAPIGGIGAHPLIGTSTSDLTTTTTSSRSVTAVAAEVGEFLAWVAASYPQHNGDAQITIKPERDARLVAQLLTGPPARSVARLQAMAIALWTITPRDDTFLAESDRGLRVLQHGADRLERLVLTRTSVARVTRSVIPAAALMGVLDCLATLTVGAVGIASQRVAAALTHGDPHQWNLAALDDELFGAACLDVDLTACEAEAAQALAPFQPRMPAAQYAAALAAARERAIRTRAHLPDLSVLARRTEARA